MDTKQEMLEKLLKENKALEDKVKTYDNLMIEVQYKLYGIESILKALVNGAYNESIDDGTLRSGTDIALDSLSVIVRKIESSI